MSSTRAGVSEVSTGGGAGIDAGAMKRSLSGSPQHSVSAPFVLAASSAVQTWVGVAHGEDWRISAAAPATCGDAIDVPLSTSVALLLVMPADRMSTPGAKMSLHAPKFENAASSSNWSEAATVIAFVTCAGE